MDYGNEADYIRWHQRNADVDILFAMHGWNLPNVTAFYAKCMIPFLAHASRPIITNKYILELFISRFPPIDKTIWKSEHPATQESRLLVLTLEVL